MAYTTATIKAIDPPGSDDRQHLVVTFTGAGEIAKDVETYIDGGTTGLALKQWRDRIIAQLNGRKSIAATLNVNDVIPAAPAPPDTSARDGWLADAARLVRMKALVDAGGMSASNTEYVALKTSVTNGYSAAYAPFI